MAIPRKYLNTQETAIASFDFVDIADGTGIRNFLLAIAEDSGGESFLILQDALHSKQVEKGSNFDVNFDLTAFNLPQTVTGTAYASFGASESTVGGIVWTISLQVKKVSDGVETNVSSAITFDLDNKLTMLLFPIPLTQTHFKKGDILRLNIITTNGSADSSTDSIGFDPQGRDGSLVNAANNQTTIFKFAVPFKIDL